MGKATKWLRLLLGSKKPSSSSSQSSPPAKDKKKTGANSKWGQLKSSDNNERNPVGATWSSDEPSPTPYIESLDANKHAIAVAAATAAVAEAALAAAQAAAEVVKLTNAGGTRTVSSSYAGGVGSREWRRELAAIKIQSAFRAYLARRALRALKGLVKLQALVRGRIVRKQSADMLRRMQAMARIQARACANRVPISWPPHSQMKASKFPCAGSATLKGYDIRQGLYGTKHAEPNLKRGGSRSSINDNISTEKLHLDSSWLEHWMEESAWNNHIDTFKNVYDDDGQNDKILEVDTWKPLHSHRQSDKTFQASQYFSTWKDNGQGKTVFDPILGLSTKFQKPNLSVSSEEVTSFRSLNFPPKEDQRLPWAAEYSPRVHSASPRPGSTNRRGPFTPTRSECSRSLFVDYLGHPNYMANTESSLAKVRSQSAPRQRMQNEKPTRKKLIRDLCDVETSSEKGTSPYANFRRKNRLEIPVRGDTIGYRMACEARR